MTACERPQRLSCTGLLVCFSDLIQYKHGSQRVLGKRLLSIFVCVAVAIYRAAVWWWSVSGIVYSVVYKCMFCRACFCFERIIFFNLWGKQSSFFNYSVHVSKLTLMQLCFLLCVCCGSIAFCKDVCTARLWLLPKPLVHENAIYDRYRTENDVDILIVVVPKVCFVRLCSLS